MANSITLETQMPTLPVRHAVRINGHISWDGQLNGLPETIYAFLVFEGFDRKIIVDAVETQLSMFVRARGMSVQKDQGQIIDLRATEQDRMFVPMDWIVFIDYELIQFPHELSMADEDGVERLSNGTIAVTQ